jgi:hypothetical protein
LPRTSALYILIMPSLTFAHVFTYDLLKMSETA